MYIIHSEEMGSTNQYISENMQKMRLPESCIIITDYQTGGRGQAGNSWESERGKNLTFSILLRPEYITANETFIISQIVSLAIKEIIDGYTGGDVRVKWPNDIYWRDRKICGILIENTIMGLNINSSIVGIGLNVNQTVFNSNAPNPVSLSMITGKEYDLKEVLGRIVNMIFYYYNKQFEEGADRMDGIVAAYKDSLYRRDGFFDYRDANGVFKARIIDVEYSGLLVLELQDCSVRRYAFKEVSYVI